MENLDKELETLSVDELIRVKQKIDRIIDKKENRQKELWENAVDAIKNYCSEFGEIGLIYKENEFYFSKNANFSEPGIVSDLYTYFF